MRILDSACTKTVTSKVWLNAFFDALMNKEKKNLLNTFQLTQKLKFVNSGSYHNVKSKISITHWQLK